MNVETKEVTLPLDGDLEAAVNKLKAEGWGILPGTVPMGTYILCRAAPDGNAGGLGQLIVDPDGVMILPASAHKKKKN